MGSAERADLLCAMRVRSAVGGRIGRSSTGWSDAPTRSSGGCRCSGSGRYFVASQNSGSASTLYAFLSVVPVVLCGDRHLRRRRGQHEAFAEDLIDHLNLTGTTADLVRETFGTASSNALAASLAAIVSFLIWGVGIGQIYQNVYSRAWASSRLGSRPGAVRDLLLRAQRRRSACSPLRRALPRQAAG